MSEHELKIEIDRLRYMQSNTQRLLNQSNEKLESLKHRLEAAENVGTTGIEMLHFINNPYAAPEVVHNAIVDFQQAVNKWQEVAR